MVTGYRKPELSVALSQGKLPDVLVTERGEMRQAPAAAVAVAHYAVGLSPHCASCAPTAGTVALHPPILAQGARPAMPLRCPRAFAGGSTTFACGAACNAPLASERSGSIVGRRTGRLASWRRILRGPT